MDNEITDKELKKQIRNTYMRNYMRVYNETRRPRRNILTKEQRQHNLKKQQKIYYNKNRDIILQKKSVINREKRIKVLQAEIQNITSIKN